MTLVRVLAIGFIDDQDVGQAALDIEMAGLIERYPPGNRMTHRSTSVPIKDLSGNELASRLRTLGALQLLYARGYERGREDGAANARDRVKVTGHAFVVRERVVGVVEAKSVSG